MAVTKIVVGICSRDGQENFKWLINVLQAVVFQSLIQSVIPVYITNDFRSFTDALAQCSFVILYHTKNRGRLNIANVTDSLYDDELKYLASWLGRNVVVLLDDLEDSSEESKRRILSEQPLIKECACDLILISGLEKQEANLTGSDPSWNPPSASPDAFNSIERKIYKLKHCMEVATGVSSAKKANETSTLLENETQDKQKGPNPSPGRTSWKKPLILGGSFLAVLVIILIIVLSLTL